MTKIISRATYWKGMPVMDENKVKFNGISLTFNHDDYIKFLEAINTDAAETLRKAKAVSDRYFKEKTIIIQMMEDVRSIFYDHDSEAEFFFKKDSSEISMDEVNAFLEKYNDRMGFQ